MHESKSCHHRFSLHEETVGFNTNDGLDVFISGARFQQCISCGNVEVLIDSSEMIVGSQIEKRTNLFTPINMSTTLMNL